MGGTQVAGLEHQAPAKPLPARRVLFQKNREEEDMSIGAILLIILILILVGALPTWPHARSWGYGPSGIVGVIVVIVIVLFLLGRL